MSELPNDGIFSTKSSRAVLTIYSIIFHNKQCDEIVLVSALLSSCISPCPRRIKKVQNRRLVDRSLDALNRIAPNLDIRVLLHSSSNRFGCNSERKDKYTNPKDSRVRVNTSIRPSDLLRQPVNTHP